MIVFVTGGSGFIGSHIVRKLVAQGHHVLALARSEKSTNFVTELGAEAVQGDIEDVEGLKKIAARADAVIHTAFNHSSFSFERYTVDLFFIVSRYFSFYICVFV